jgi:hypothetical protein
LPKNVLIDSNDKLNDINLGKSEQVFVYSRSAGRHGKDPLTLILSADGKTSYTLDLTKLNHKKVVETLQSTFSIPNSGLVGHDVKSTLKMLKAARSKRSAKGWARCFSRCFFNKCPC